MKNELKRLKRALSPDDPKCLEEKSEDKEMINTEEVEYRRRSRETFLKITRNFLRRMKQDVLADSLQSSKALYKFCSIYLLELLLSSQQYTAEEFVYVCMHLMIHLSSFRVSRSMPA